MGWEDYAKIKKIGEGSFGAAWLVKKIKDDKRYVIKLINVSRMHSKEREEARKEVSVLAQMKHPNIVSYIDSFEESGNLCIVMDYCDGGDLYSKIRSTRGVHFGEEQILDWFVQITLALKHVHDRKILHRDLKSQNIFLTKEGVVKLGDFGVAKVLSNTMDFARTAIGTPYYMSPELVEHKPYNNKSDVWSLGCVLYELANMHHPFEANNMQMLAYKILRGNFEPISPKYSYELRNLVTSMLKRNPRERPSVNGILRKAFIMKRCEKFLTNEVLMEEFSHTVLHGENFMRKIQNLNQPKLLIKPTPTPNPRAISAAAQITPVKQLVAPSPKPQYDPSKIYNAPVVRRSNPSQLKKSIEKRNIGFLEQKKQKEIAAGCVALASPRLLPIEYLDDRKSPYLDNFKNKRDFEDALKPKKQLQDLAEKQKQERIRKAREQGWQNVLIGDLNTEENKDPYAYRHQQLDQLAERNNLEQQLLKPAQTPRVISRQSSNQQLKPKSSVIVNNFQANDFKNRREEYERNRARGKRINQNILAAKPPIQKRDEKTVYEENLRVVRLKNFNNRKPIKKIIDSNKEALSAQQAKLNALKQQADEQRIKFKSDLEKRRVEAYEKERKHVLNENKTPRLQAISPTPPVNMTQVLNAIGVVGKQITKEEVLKNPENNNRKSWLKETDLTPLDKKTIIQPTLESNDLRKYRPIISPRKLWGFSHETIIQNLNNVTLISNSSGESDHKTRTIKEIFTPEKISTLKVTKNLLLGVTFGQFDPKNTNLLRTCSEPDMTKILPLKDIDSIETKIEKIEPSNDLEQISQRLTKSLEDLDKIIEKGGQSISSDESNSENNDLIETYESELKDELNETSSEDSNQQVELRLEELLLKVNNETVKPNDKVKNRVCFAASNNLVKALPVSDCNLTADSLEDEQLQNSDNDLEEVSLNGESDSDTEFEDEYALETLKEVLSSSKVEEIRLNLERNLEEKKFIDAYPKIERLVLSEVKEKSDNKKSSLSLFKKLFPSVDTNLYEQFYQLILADNEISYN